MPQTTITDVRTVAITVRDQDQALGFYVDTLGFEKRLDAPFSPTMRWVEVAPPGAATSVALVASDPRPTHRSTRRRYRHPLHRSRTPRSSTPGCAASGSWSATCMLWDGVPPMYTVDDPDGNRFYIVEEIR